MEFYLASNRSVSQPAQLNRKTLIYSLFDVDLNHSSLNGLKIVE